jgi:hypothetical protein
LDERPANAASPEFGCHDDRFDLTPVPMVEEAGEAHDPPVHLRHPRADALGRR